MSEKLSPWWKPEIFEKKRKFLSSRQTMMRSIRNYFDSEAFIEVDTPALQISPGLEPHLMAFETTLVGPNPAERQKLYLHTSPEFTMKKLLAAGLPKIWQASHVYRNGERTTTHHPEFTMLEWYRSNDSYETLITDCQNIVRQAAIDCDKKVFTYEGIDCDPFRDWEILSIDVAFQKYAQIDLQKSQQNPLNPDRDILAAQAEKIGIRVSPSDLWDDIFFRVSLEKIEPHLGIGQPTILIDYPISMAALSRPKQGAPHLAERFELYISRLELANAFGELTCAKTQLKRFKQDMTLKQKLYGYQYPIDMDFIDAVAQMPEAAGIALGIDRLAMLCAGTDSIDDVLFAPVAHPH